MAWQHYSKKPKAPLTWSFEAIAVRVADLAALLQQKREGRWKVHYEPMCDGSILVVSEQSSQYAPKPPKVKRAKKAKPAVVEDVTE